LNTEVSFWESIAGKAITDFVAGVIAVFGTVNVAVFLSFITVTSAGIQFNRAGAVDELALLVPALATGVASALVAAIRRQRPAIQARLAMYWTAIVAIPGRVWAAILAKLRG
jgi:hypothetical protein